MQQFLIDVDKPTGLLVIYAKQADSMSRFFSVSLFSGGSPLAPPEGSALTVRFGAPGMPAGWYDTITEPDGGSHSAFSVDGNTITVELAEQALSTPGTNTVALLINGADGYQLASGNFTLKIDPVPGLEAPEATVYYNALTEQVAKALANANAAAASADAAEQSAAEAAASAEAAQQVAQGAVGYYETTDALRQAHPTAEAGNWAIVGSTDTVWVWDIDTSTWKDSHQATDLSNYYTKQQTGANFYTKAQTDERYLQPASLSNFYSKQQVQNLIAPIGYIFSWAPADDSPDLSTSTKVAAYFGFGTWAAYGTGQVLVGLDAGQTEFATVGQTGGEKTHTLTTRELPNENIPLVAYGFKAVGIGQGNVSTEFHLEWGNGNSNGALSASRTGGNQPHNNLQPYVVVYRWQRVK